VASRIVASRIDRLMGSQGRRREGRFEDRRPSESIK
jgi:hypothetical protein